MTSDKPNYWRSSFITIPVWGIGVFILFYALAAALYPGGSKADNHAAGFSLLNNYWCDLLNYYARNGAYNIARPIALTAMVILCLSLALFWYYLPRLFHLEWVKQQTIRYSGITAMLITMFVFTQYHDAVINLAGFLGVIAFATAFIELYKSQLYKLFGLGLFSLILCIVCYSIYRTGIFGAQLPVIQKITFLLCLLWFGATDVYMYRKARWKGMD